MKKVKRKGLSPVIATVLLVTMVIIIGLIIFLWIRGMTQEAITKFGGKNIQLVCDEVYFDASYSGTTLSISNSGNVPIFGMKVKVVGDGSYITKDLREEASDWPEVGLNQGLRFSESGFIFDGDEIILIPVLIGTSDSGKKTYVCDEKQYGYQILI